LLRSNAYLRPLSKRQVPFQTERDEARQRDLSGSLLLDVAINPDGSVREITVRRSSGYSVLDDAAVRIVELASPFAPFPDDFVKDIDILHVTRTWKFLNNASFSSR
jgi:protein TonB